MPPLPSRSVPLAPGAVLPPRVHTGGYSWHGTGRSTLPQRWWRAQLPARVGVAAPSPLHSLAPLSPPQEPHPALPTPQRQCRGRQSGSAPRDHTLCLQKQETQGFPHPARSTGGGSEGGWAGEPHSSRPFRAGRLGLPTLPAGGTPKLSDTGPGRGWGHQLPILSHTSLQTSSPRAGSPPPLLGPLCPVPGHCNAACWPFPSCPPGTSGSLHAEHAAGRSPHSWALTHQAGWPSPSCRSAAPRSGGLGAAGSTPRSGAGPRRGDSQERKALWGSGRRTGGAVCTGQGSQTAAIHRAVKVEGGGQRAGRGAEELPGASTGAAAGKNARCTPQELFGRSIWLDGIQL